MALLVLPEGLRKIVESPEYRQALKLPDEIIEEYEFLAQGEYNSNYIFNHPETGKKLVLRVNRGSQLHLDKQISYEANALRMLEASGRTPKLYYLDDSGKYSEEGILVMDFLPGSALNYEMDLRKAAAVLADIHSLKFPENNGLIEPSDPVAAMLKECHEMFSVYLSWDGADAYVSDRLSEMLSYGELLHKEKSMESPCKCIINTELNSSNFLIDGDRGAYLVDWEKPLIGDPAQDLGHFLVPTTTFFKTDTILDYNDMVDFISDYIDRVDGRYNTEGLLGRSLYYARITVLRGLTWCAMAMVEYESDGRQNKNPATYNKLKTYLSHDFIASMDDFLRLDY